MQKIFLKIIKFINKKVVFLSWIFLILVIDYICLFSLEKALPRFVTSVFDINLLLVFLILGWISLVLMVDKNNSNQIINQNFLKIISFILFFIVFVLLIFVLYKANYWEVSIYLFLTLVSSKVFYNYLK